MFGCNIATNDFLYVRTHRFMLDLVLATNLGKGAGAWLVGGEKCDTISINKNIFGPP